VANESEHNLYWEALINQYNLIGLGGLVALSLLMLITGVASWYVPMLIALGFEMMYLAAIPETEFFKRAVKAKYNELSDLDRAEQLERRLGRLHPVQRRRFEEISALVDDTKTNLKENDSMGSAVRGKLDTLRDRYLWLMELLNAYEHYLASIRPGQIDEALADVESQIASQKSARVRKSLEERKEVLQKRKKRLERVHENHAIVRTQVMTIEDIMRLIHESSMTIQDPRGIGEQIDDLLIDVEATEEAVHDLDSIGSISGQDELDAFDKELEEAVQFAEMEVRSR
jgi:hypothetical protein